MPPVFRGIKVHLHADRLHVSEQELDTDMEHAKIHVRCLGAAVAARACASMQRARYLWLAPSTDSDSCSHLFCLRRLKRHQGTDFSSICRKEFDYGKTPSLYPPFHPLSGKTTAEFAQEPSHFARMAPGPSRRRGRPAPPTPRIWLTAGALLAVACQGGGERPLETSPGLSLDPWGLAEPAAAAARASEPVIAQPAVGQIRTSGAVPRAPGG